MPRLSPLTGPLGPFRHNRRGYWSLWILLSCLS